jgi:hypothetical protein
MVQSTEGIGFVNEKYNFFFIEFVDELRLFIDKALQGVHGKNLGSRLKPSVGSPESFSKRFYIILLRAHENQVSKNFLNPRSIHVGTLRVCKIWAFF